MMSLLLSSAARLTSPEGASIAFVYRDFRSTLRLWLSKIKVGSSFARLSGFHCQPVSVNVNVI